TTTFKISAVLKREPDELAAVYAQQPADKAKAKAVLEQLKTGPFDVLAVDQTEGTRNPAPPFTTSSLQQEASRKLGYSVKRTMNLAQRLYEAGHITYMRTDSVSLSGQSTAMAKDYIGAEFGQNYHQFRRYTTKTRGAQEAHEAIRPTRVERAEAGEDPAQAKLYKLIRGRFLASQMATAKLLKTKIILSNGKAELTAEGEVITFDGWLKAYPQSALKDEVLPKLAVGDKLTLIAAKAEETPGRVPPRYTEANLVRTLEEMGIGRPSTYAPTISTIQDRGYVSREPAPTKEVELTILRLKAGKISQQTEVKTLGGDSKKLLPTDTATVVTDFLLKHFKDVVDYDFTAEVEDEFDAIEVGQRAWNAMIKDFYTDFHKTVMAAAKVTRKEATQARKIGVDPQTKRPILARFGRYGPMLQRGEAEDETKPDFAPLPPGATLENVTLELALKMFELPRDLGEQDGQPIKANIGRYGPYVQLGSTFASIPKDEDVFTIGLSRAQKLIAERQSATKKSLIKDFGDGLIVKSGRFGPYVTNGKTNAKIPKDIDPKKLTLDQVQSLLKKRA
ncbi:MAG TPA: DNA topoisomerase, partial [Candidatus Saccharimonadales bacterium]